jgi:hypothetical protein
MNKKDINNGIKAQLATASPAYPIVWPNVKSQADRPFIELTITATSREDTTLKGGSSILREFGIISAVVVADLDEGEDAANDIADLIAGVFPPGLKLDIEGGSVDILRAPNISGGLRDGSEWRVPVVIQYAARAV